MPSDKNAPKIYVHKGSTYPNNTVRIEKFEDGVAFYFPEGGGFARSRPEYEFNELYRPYNAKIDKPTWRAAHLNIDGDFAPTPGFLDGRRWNGWLMPMFTKETIDAAMVGDGIFNGLDIKYLPESDAYEVRMNDMDPADESEIYKGSDIEVDGKIEHAYSIGAGSWCWEEDDAPTAAPPAP